MSFKHTITYIFSKKGFWEKELKPNNEYEWVSFIFVVLFVLFLLIAEILINY